MRLLVVTPTLGNSRFLSAAVESVSHTGLNLQHILVAPHKAVADLGREFPDCTIVTEPRAEGMYAAINSGVHAAEPWDWFTYLNDDDLLHQGFSGMATEHMRAPDAEAIAYGNVEWIDAAGGSLGLMPLEKNPRHIGHVMKLRLAPLTQQGALFSRSLYNTLGGFDPQYRYAGDFDFLVRAHAAGATFRFYDALVATWRIHGEIISLNRAAVLRESRQIAATVSVHASSLRLRYERLRFRMLNASRYVDRRRRTGKWRSESLFTAAAEA